MTLSERKQRVLRAIIEDYVATAQPVGSVTLVSKHRLGVSPATVRNDMADLEDLGFLEQPHTSAGRIPSDVGYRFYVDELMRLTPLDDNYLIYIRASLESRIREIEDLIRDTARVLSEQTNYLALILGPQLARTVFRTLRLLPLSEKQALLVLVTDAGFIESAVMELPSGMGQEQMAGFAALINRTLQGKTLAQVADGLITALRTDLAGYRDVVDQAFDFFTKGLNQGEGKGLTVVGTSKILGQPEFQDAAKVRQVLQAVESGAALEALNDAGDDDGIVITIGRENRHPALKGCSMVTATYRVGGQTVGTLGVLGPTRMDYARVLSVVHSVTECLSGALSRSVQFWLK